MYTCISACSAQLLEEPLSEFQGCKGWGCWELLKPAKVLHNDPLGLQNSPKEVGFFNVKDTAEAVFIYLEPQGWARITF